ncbi:unnamed protein product [Auanema sp. JU1783]|nr:unnamed protein product [Auanema sp. JU1783]
MRAVLIVAIHLFFFFKYCRSDSMARVPIPGTCKGFRYDGRMNSSSSMVVLNLQGEKSNLTATGRRTEVVYGTSSNLSDRIRLTRRDDERFNVIVTFPQKGKNVWQIRYGNTATQYLNFEPYSYKITIWITIYNCCAIEQISKCGCT